MTRKAARHALAPMSPVVAAVTYFFLTVPPLLPMLGLHFGTPTEAEALAWVGAAMLVLYLAVWALARPHSFEVVGRYFEIRFPLWRRRVALGEIRDARLVEALALRHEIGFPIRFGIGGLWGVFGLLWTTKRGLLEVYVSRQDGFVFLERLDGRPLLITPSEPTGLVEALLEANPP